MKEKDPTLWAALRLCRILERAPSCPKTDALSSFSPLLEAQKAVQESWRLYLKAHSRGWTHAAEIYYRRLLSNIARVHSESSAVHPPRIALIPTLADTLAEFNCLHDEFDEVEILPRNQRIGVKTDEIVLEDVRLGAFSIQLHFDRLVNRKDVSAFSIVAEEANPASGNSYCTHPHVQDKSLCAGDASAPISNALAEGRIGDAFQLVNRVLHTYNGSSAYVSLSDWNGQSCSDCGRTSPSDCLYGCEQCGGDFCDECICTCSRCEQSICLGCSDTNEDLDRLCPKCKKLDDQEREDLYEEEETEVSDDSILDPSDDEEPQPSTETDDEHSQTPDSALPEAELLGGATDGARQAAVTPDIAASQAA